MNRDPAARAPRRVASRLACSVLVLTALAALSPRARAADPPERPATAADCRSLLHQFDVAWPAHRDGTRAASAQHSRDLGAANCAQNHYGEGVRQLRRALHDIGVKPVKIVSPAPPR